MALSQQTLDHLLDAESHLRAALKSAAVNENSTVIHIISRIISEVNSVKKFEDLMDLIDRTNKTK